jgi:hypothetical protein
MRERVALMCIHQTLWDQLEPLQNIVYAESGAERGDYRTQF